MEEVNSVKFWINGKLVTDDDPDPSMSLARFLRSRGLTGTKISCGEGSCGACTVLLAKLVGHNLEEVTINACITPVISLHGAHVTTVEGAGSTRDGLHPAQERLYKCHGSQCGFCSPGMVMSMVGVLKSCPTPDIEDITNGLQGNLCRCTGYRPIVEAFSTFSSKVQLEEKTIVKDNEQVATYDASTFKDYVDEPFDEKIFKEMEELSRMSLIVKQNTKETSWLKPSTIKDAYELIEKYPTAHLRQGGTGGYKKFDNIQSKIILDISSLSELQKIEKESNGIKIGSGVTFTNLRKYLTTLLANEPKESFQTLKVISSIIDSLATKQVRNVASIGGTILWAHPASDIVPLLIVRGAVLQIGTMNGTREIAVEKFLREEKSKLKEKEILLNIFIPFNKENEGVRFYRHARRKTVDLAIANMAVAYQESETGNLENVKIVIGGIGIAIKQSKQLPIIFATKTCSLMSSSKLELLTQFDLCTCVEQDLRNGDTAVSQLDLLAFRVSLCVGFLQQFREDILKHSPAVKSATSSLKSHQLFEKTPSSQVRHDPITRPLPHVSSAEQCSGEAVYVDDIPKYANELLLIPVQSTVAHGRIKSVSTDRALSIPGVHGWIDAKNVPGCNFMTVGGIPDEELFPSEFVEYVGQIVGLIAADNEDAGRAAVKAVEIDYESAKPILTLNEAIKQDSFHVSKRHLKRIQNAENEEIEKKFVEGKILLGGQEHFYFETHSALAVPSGEKQEMTIYFTTQEPSSVHAVVSSVLNIPQHKIIVKCKRVGGGFGGKERYFVALMTAVGAHVLRRPCRLILTREEDVDTTGHRHETRASYNLEVGQDGRILSSEFVFDVNAGMSTDLSHAWVDILMRRIDGGYTLRNFEGNGVAWKTNLMSNTAFRGFGSPEGALIIEDAIDKIAIEIGLDPAIVREKNLTREGDLLHHGTIPVNEDFLITCWKECLEQSKYWNTKTEIEHFNNNNKFKKRGIAIIPMKFAPTIPFKMLNQAGAYVRVYADGSILLSHGGAEMGQGLHTKMIQVAAKVLGVEMSKIHIVDTSTETVPNATPTGGSSGADLNGHAVINACNKIVKGIEPYRMKFPEDSWEQIIAKAYENRTQLAAFGFYNSSPLDYDFETNEGSMFNYLTFGVGCSVVEVDCLTGEHEVLRTDIVMDVGKSLNPAIDIGQIQGAFVQGYGYMTMEEMLHSDQGEVLNKNLSSYKIPTVQDIPKEFNVTLLRNAGTKEEAVFSSKGIGEPPLTLAVSVVCAIRQAVMSYRVENDNTAWVQLDIPLTSQRIRMACEDDIVKFVTSRETLKHTDVKLLSIMN